MIYYKCTFTEILNIFIPELYRAWNKTEKRSDISEQILSCSDISHNDLTLVEIML